MKPSRVLAKSLLSALCVATAQSSAADSLPAVDTRMVAASDPGSALGEGWQRGAFIEIFVRGYKDSDGDGIGDLRGLTQSLDYLHDLGIRGIWLMPITRSQDHDHGYAVSDYRDIEPAYGSLADFDELLKQAHARGIGVIMDYVVNHSAASNPIFIDASRSPDSRYRAWYVWRDAAPAGWKILDKDPWVKTPNGVYLAQFSQTMPDFNLLNRDVVEYHKDSLRFWLNRAVDGFRFDAVTHLVENGPEAWHDQPEDYVLMNEFRSVVDTYARRYVVCEATLNAVGYAAPTACGAAFALDRGKQIVAAARGERDAIAAVAKYFTLAPETMATMVSNHDLFAGERLWDQVHGDENQYRLAAATYLLQPGTPFIYYGEEIGMSAAPGLEGDRKLRTPMSWKANASNAGFSTAKPYRVPAANVMRQNVQSQQKAARSLLSYYQALLAVRNTYPSIARGSYESPIAEGQLLSYRRKLGDETTVVVINYGSNPTQALLHHLATGTKLKQVFPDRTVVEIPASADGTSKIDVGAQSVLVFTLN